MTEKPDRPAAVRPATSLLYPWYDSVWLSDYTRAKAIIQRVKPAALRSFEDAFQVFRTRKDFQVVQLEKVFDDDTLERIKRTVATLRPADLELHEARRFGRFVVHGQPYFTELHRVITSVVSDVVGEPVDASYNFLSLYSHLGVCAPHMDSPQAKYTLDLCVSQTVSWPIYCSQVQDWPEPNSEPWPSNWQELVKQTASLRFTPYVLEPGKAVVFSGSSQWHYREPIPSEAGQQSCDLLFFHFIPRGTSELVLPKNWARLFDIPELGEVTE